MASSGTSAPMTPSVWWTAPKSPLWNIIGNSTNFSLPLHLTVYSFPLSSYSLLGTLIDFFSLVDSKNYGITIKEINQPLLIHRPKERSKPGGKVNLCPTFSSFSFFAVVIKSYDPQSALSPLIKASFYIEATETSFFLCLTAILWP